MTTIYENKFFDAYVGCALWSSMDYCGVPLDEHYDRDNIDSDSLVSMLEECRDFIESNHADLAEHDDPSQAGHDFWLTRNSHGTGFWDRGLGKLGGRLSDAAKVYGSSELYVGDDHKLYISS